MINMMTRKGVKCQGNFKTSGLSGLPVGPWAGGEILSFSTNHQLPQFKENINLEMLDCGAPIFIPNPSD